MLTDDVEKLVKILSDTVFPHMLPIAQNYQEIPHHKRAQFQSGS